MSEPLLNARFRVEIQGLPATSATEVVLPEVRIGAARSKRARVQYGPLVMRRYMTSSGEWYEWWDRARRSAAPRREIVVVLMNRFQADVNRWMFSGAVPAAYAVSPLNALRGEPLVETLELTISGLRMEFGGAAPTAQISKDSGRR